MIKLTTFAAVDTVPDAELELTFEQRQRCVLRVPLTDGRDAGIKLERSESPHANCVLRSECGVNVRVVAAAEWLSVAGCADPLLFARACYHLGNRHVKLQIQKDRLCYQRDHVLDEMLDQLGLDVEHLKGPFNPEQGAYAGGHSHSHDHDHTHADSLAVETEHG